MVDAVLEFFTMSEALPFNSRVGLIYRSFFGVLMIGGHFPIKFYLG
jgi:hypothetical protein